MRDGWNDDRLLAALRDAMTARDAVPAWFVDAGKNAYAWHDIDAELAQLTYDSSRLPGLAAGIRSEEASVRAMTFTSAHLSIELEVTGSSLIGQITPPQEATIEARTTAGVVASAVADDIGCFSVDPAPVSPFRLHCRLKGGMDVVTGWITL